MPGSSPQAVQSPPRAPIRCISVITASRRPHTQAAATAGGIPVSTRSSRSLAARILESQSISDWAMAGSVSPRINAWPPRERGAHNDIARIHAVNVSKRASTPNAYKLVQASSTATARYSWPADPCSALTGRTRGSKPGVAMTIIGWQATSRTRPCVLLDKTTGTPRNNPASSAAVPAAPTRTTRIRSCPQPGHFQLMAAAPHQRHRGVESRRSAGSCNGPEHLAQRA